MVWGIFGIVLLILEKVRWINGVWMILIGIIGFMFLITNK